MAVLALYLSFVFSILLVWSTCLFIRCLQDVSVYDLGLNAQVEFNFISFINFRINRTLLSKL